MDLKHLHLKIENSLTFIKSLYSRDRRTFNFLLTYWIEVYFEKEENLPFISERLFDLKIHQETDT